jgi:nicotinamidase-related amidase
VNRDPKDAQALQPVVANAEALLVAARRAGALVRMRTADHAAGGATAARTLRDTDNRLKPIDPKDLGSHRPLIDGGHARGAHYPRAFPEASDLLVPKHRWSAFHGTFLDSALRARGVDTVILCGGSTDVGIASLRSRAATWATTW